MVISFVSGAAAATNDPRSHYFRDQIIQTAKKLNYFANQSIYRSWVRLVLRNTNVTEVLIAFHGIGWEFQGVLGCSASWFQRLEAAEGEREVGPVTPITDSVFLMGTISNSDEKPIFRCLATELTCGGSSACPPSES